MKIISDKLKEKISDWALEYVPGPIYRIPSRIVGFFRAIKWSFQKLVRLSHASDCDLWNLSDHLVDIILPKLKAFKEMPRLGFPGIFSDFDKEHAGPWANKEEYDKDVANGDIVGGGEEAWEKVIDEMIFAFEYIKADNHTKYYKKFVEKYGCDWFEKKPENRIVKLWYTNPETGCAMMIGEDGKKPDAPWILNENSFFSKPFYYNSSLHMEASSRAQKGFELFGKHFMGLWD